MARQSKLISCSICFKPTEARKTATIGGKRVCHDCRKTAMAGNEQPKMKF